MPYRRFFPEAYQPADILQTMGKSVLASLPGDFSVTVWNMYKGRQRGWHDDFEKISAGSQLVLLQESVMNTRHDPVFMDSARHEWIMARSYRSVTTLAATGIKTGCVAPAKGQKFFLSPDMEPLFKTPKLLLATSYGIEGCDKTLLVINMHAINFVSLEKYRRQIAQIVEAVEAHDGPLIVAGDFNTWNDLRYRVLVEITSKIGLVEAALKRRGRMHHLNRHLDYIFYRGLELKEAAVMTSVKSSDHYPIRADFTVPA